MKICISKQYSLLAKALLCAMLEMVVVVVRSDISKDKAECQDQLITLSSCLSYVGNEARTPAPQCCTVLHEKLNHTKKCLCILVKDRNEPSLGLKINATRALHLPGICHVYSNPLECIGLLGMSPKSPEAQIFIQAANNTQAEDIAPTSAKNDGGKRRWTKMGIFDILLLLCLALTSV